MSQKPIFAGYFKHLATTARQGDAREESFYPALGHRIPLGGRSEEGNRPGRQPGPERLRHSPGGGHRLLRQAGQFSTGRAKRTVALGRAFRNPRKQIRLAARARPPGRHRVEG